MISGAWVKRARIQEGVDSLAGVLSGDIRKIVKRARIQEGVDSLAGVLSGDIRKIVTTAI
jgi:hypothetical protein